MARMSGNTAIQRSSSSHGSNSNSDTGGQTGAEEEYSESLQTVDDVGHWLDSISLSKYKHSFRDNHVDGVLLLSLTSTELRDDLKVTDFQHRRQILEAIDVLKKDERKKALRSESNGDDAQQSEKMPEHGRILDHLANVRTYHSWLRVGVQFMAFAIVTLRLAPNFRETKLISSTAFFFASISILAMIHAVLRYRVVVRMIEQTRLSHPSYTPDLFGMASLVVLILCAAILVIVIIAMPDRKPPT